MQQDIIIHDAFVAPCYGAAVAFQISYSCHLHPMTNCSKLSTVKHLPTQDIAETEEKLATARTELHQSQQTLEHKQEHLTAVEARSRDLYDTTVRLEAHISDLESRKRAPLYQKKQEEELKAAIEKAQECEIRAVDAEIKYKEAKVYT